RRVLFRSTKRERERKRERKKTGRLPYLFDCKGAYDIFGQQLGLDQCHLHVPVDLSVIWPVLAALHLHTPTHTHPHTHMHTYMHTHTFLTCNAAGCNRIP